MMGRCVSVSRAVHSSESDRIPPQDLMDLVNLDLGRRLGAELMQVLDVSRQPSGISCGITYTATAVVFTRDEFDEHLRNHDVALLNAKAEVEQARHEAKRYRAEIARYRKIVKGLVDDNTHLTEQLNSKPGKGDPQ